MERNTRSSVRVLLQSESKGSDSGIKFLEIRSRERKRQCMCGRKMLREYKTKFMFNELKKYSGSKEYDTHFSKKEVSKNSIKSFKRDTMSGENKSTVRLKQSSSSVYCLRNSLKSVKKVPHKIAQDASNIDVIFSQICKRESSSGINSHIFNFVDSADNIAHQTCSIPRREKNSEPNTLINNSLWKYLNSGLRHSLENQSYYAHEQPKEAKLEINETSSRVNDSITDSSFSENISLPSTNNDELLSNEILAGRDLLPKVSTTLSYNNGMTLKLQDKPLVFENNIVSDFRYLTCINMGNIPMSVNINFQLRKSNLGLFLQENGISSPIVCILNELLNSSTLRMISRKEKSFKYKTLVIGNSMQHCTFPHIPFVKANASKGDNRERHVGCGSFKYKEIEHNRPVKEILNEKISLQNLEASSSLPKKDAEKENCSKTPGKAVMIVNNLKFKEDKLVVSEEEHTQNGLRGDFDKYSVHKNSIAQKFINPKSLQNTNYQTKICGQPTRCKNEPETTILKASKVKSFPTKIYKSIARKSISHDNPIYQKKSKRQSKGVTCFRDTSRNTTQTDNLAHYDVSRKRARSFKIGNTVWKQAFKSPNNVIVELLRWHK